MRLFGALTVRLSEVLNVNLSLMPSFQSLPDILFGEDVMKAYIKRILWCLVAVVDSQMIMFDC